MNVRAVCCGNWERAICLEAGPTWATPNYRIICPLKAQAILPPLHSSSSVIHSPASQLCKLQHLVACIASRAGFFFTQLNKITSCLSLVRSCLFCPGVLPYVLQCIYACTFASSCTFCLCHWHIHTFTQFQSSIMCLFHIMSCIQTTYYTLYISYTNWLENIIIVPKTLH